MKGAALALGLGLATASRGVDALRLRGFMDLPTDVRREVLREVVQTGEPEDWKSLWALSKELHAHGDIGYAWPHHPALRARALKDAGDDAWKEV